MTRHLTQDGIDNLILEGLITRNYEPGSVSLDIQLVEHKDNPEHSWIGFRLSEDNHGNMDQYVKYVERMRTAFLFLIAEHKLLHRWKHNTLNKELVDTLIRLVHAESKNDYRPWHHYSVFQTVVGVCDPGDMDWLGDNPNQWTTIGPAGFVKKNLKKEPMKPLIHPIQLNPKDYRNNIKAIPNPQENHEFFRTDLVGKEGIVHAPVKLGVKFKYTDFIPGFDHELHQVDPNLRIKTIIMECKGYADPIVFDVGIFVGTAFIAGWDLKDLFLMCAQISGTMLIHGSGDDMVQLQTNARATFHIQTGELETFDVEQQCGFPDDYKVVALEIGMSYYNKVKPDVPVTP